MVKLSSVGRWRQGQRAVFVALTLTAIVVVVLEYTPKLAPATPPTHPPKQQPRHQLGEARVTRPRTVRKQQCNSQLIGKDNNDKRSSTKGIYNYPLIPLRMEAPIRD